MEGIIKVGYAFPETKKWINPNNQEEYLTIYEEPRWSFENDKEILEILKNSDPAYYEDLQKLMKEYPDEHFSFSLGKSLRYNEGKFYQADKNNPHDYSLETIQEKLDNTFIFRYWNNYDDHKIDLNNHVDWYEITIKDKTLSKKLNDMIYEHVNDNIINYNYYKHWREKELTELLRENLNSVTENVHETEYGYYLEGSVINDKLKAYLDLPQTNREFLLFKTYHTDENKNINFTNSNNELYIDEIVLDDDEIWETKTTNKLSYYAPKEVVNIVSNFYDNYISDVIKPIAPQLALEVISKEEFTYANSTKKAYTDYVIRTEKGIIDEINGTNNLFEENDIPVIMCRIPTDSFSNTEFYLSKYNLNSLTENEKLNEIEKNKSGKIEITDVDLLSQITGNINWYNKNERIDAAINLIKEKYHTAEGREYLQEINSYDYKEKEHLVDSVLGMLKEHYNEENKLITLETSKDDTQTIENFYTAEDLEILIKARDAVKYGVDSLEFTRPNAEQINKGIENSLDFDILTKGYDIFGSLEGYNLNGKILQNISNIERIDVMEVFTSDDEAAKQYEFDSQSKLLKEGLDIWIGDNDVKFYSIPDTPENRDELKEYLLDKPLTHKFDFKEFTEENFNKMKSDLLNKNFNDYMYGSIHLGSMSIDFQQREEGLIDIDLYTLGEDGIGGYISFDLSKEIPYSEFFLTQINKIDIENLDYKDFINWSKEFLVDRIESLCGQDLLAEARRPTVDWNDEKEVTQLYSSKLGEKLLNVVQNNPLSMSNIDKNEALELLSKGADAKEALLFTAADANLYENCHWLINHLPKGAEKYFTDKDFADKMFELSKASVILDEETWTAVSDIGYKGFEEIAVLCGRKEEAEKYYKEILEKHTELTKETSKEQQLSSQEEKEYQEYLNDNKISDPEMNRRIDSGEIFGTYEEIEKENTINNSDEFSRYSLIGNKKEITKEELDEIIEYNPESIDIKSLKKYTEKKYIDLSKEEKNSLINDLLKDDYLKYKNCYISRSKLLYDSSETLLKEVSILDKLNDMGYEIYLLPYAYARDKMDCYQKSTDSISDNKFIEFKTTPSTGKNAGLNAYKSSRLQAENVFISLVNETSEQRVINNIYGYINESKRKSETEQNFEGFVFLNFEKDNKIVLYNFDKEGKAVRLDNPSHENLQKFLQEVEFKKNKGIKNDSQVLENPTNERSSLPNKNIHDIDSNVNKISETSISYMPHREVINNAKAARAAYCLPVLKGEKKGLWKAFNDFKRHGVFDIQGHSISTDKDGHITDNGFKQLATAMDIYRDKRFESARYVFLDKDGNIKDQLALSTFMPNHSISKLNETFEQVVKYAQASSTRVAFVHNHPSGNIEASLDDIRFTKNLEEYLNRNGKDLFAGHIILDHNTFNCFKPGNDWQPVSFNTTEKDRFEKENVPEFTKTKIDSVDNLLSIAKSINDTNEYNKNWIPVVFSRTDASIGGIEYFSKDYFTQNKSEDIQKDLQNIGLRCGSNRAIPVIPKEISYDEKLHSEVINKFRDGCFYDFALGNRTAKDFNLENMSTELFNYTVKEMQTNTMVESTFELPKVDKKEIGVSSKVAENTNYYKKENIQPVDLSSYIDKSKSTEVFKHDFMLNKKFVPPFVFADNNCYIRCNAKDLKINSALKLNPEKRVDVIVTKAQFAKIISDEKLKEKISKLEEYKKTKKPITPLEVASAKMSTEQEELILAQDPHLNFTDRKLTYNAMYKEIMTDVSKLDKEKAENALTLIKQSDKDFEQIKKDFIQTNGNFSKATKNQNEVIDY